MDKTENKMESYAPNLFLQEFDAPNNLLDDKESRLSMLNRMSMEDKAEL